jgi:hypothetical protein
MKSGLIRGVFGGMNLVIHLDFPFMMAFCHCGREGLISEGLLYIYVFYKIVYSFVLKL